MIKRFYVPTVLDPTHNPVTCIVELEKILCGNTMKLDLDICH
jgi:hypothetical protein